MVYTLGMNSNDEINALKAEIVRLNDKIHTMRGLLWEWNCSSGPVWEYWKLMEIGEKPEDYSHWTEEEDDDMPLFDEDDRDFMNGL
jgi:hypothetical protein